MDQTRSQTGKSTKMAGSEASPKEISHRQGFRIAGYFAFDLHLLLAIGPEIPIPTTETSPFHSLDQLYPLIVGAIATKWYIRRLK